MTNNTDPVEGSTTPETPLISTPEEPIATEQESPNPEVTVIQTEEPIIPESSVTPPNPEPSLPDPIKEEPLEVAPPIELSSDAKCKPSLSLILFVIFIGIITFILGFLASNLLTKDTTDDLIITPTSEPTGTLTPTIDENGTENWVYYINDELNFKFSYPEGWNIETNSELYSTSFIVSDGDYGLGINILDGWGPEICVYDDTTGDLTGLESMYNEYDNFIEIEGIGMVYRRSLIEDGSFKICARELDDTDNYFSDLAFMWTSDEDTSLTGSVRYIVPALFDIGDDGISSLDRILASLEGI